MANALVRDGDVLRIGPYRLSIDAAQIRWLDDDLGVGVSVSHVRVSAGGHVLLHAVPFTVKPGQRLGIAGPSGAGKSTLLEALVGFVPTDAGDVAINGVDVYENGGNGLQSLCGYTPQQNIVHRRLSVRHALLYSAAYGSRAM